MIVFYLPYVFIWIYVGFRFVIGLPSAIIHVCLGCSLAKTIQLVDCWGIQPFLEAIFLWSSPLFTTPWWFIPRIVSGLVHPSYVCGLCPHKNPIYNQCYNPPKRFVGSSPPSSWNLSCPGRQLRFYASTPFLAFLAFPPGTTPTDHPGADAIEEGSRTRAGCASGAKNAGNVWEVDVMQKCEKKSQSKMSYCMEKYGQWGSTSIKMTRDFP